MAMGSSWRMLSVSLVTAGLSCLATAADLPPGPSPPAAPTLPDTVVGQRGSSAGGGYSTAGDLLRFVKAVLSDRLLSPEYTDWFLMGREVGTGPEGERPAREQGGITAVGGAPGIGAMLSFELDSPYTVVVLTNLDPDAVDRVGRKIRRTLAAIRE